MSTDEEFTRHLRDRINAVGPAITVDTSHVIRGARRRRAVTRGTTATVAVTAVALMGLVATSHPWTRATGYAPAQPAPGVTEPSTTPSTNPLDVGWPKAEYWRTLTEVRQAGSVRRTERWNGHTAPGLSVSDGDLTKADVLDPGAWANLTIDGTETIVTWDELYALPTDPVALEELLRGAIEPDRRAGTDDEKVFGMIWDLLNSSPASPPLRRALWTVAEGLPGAITTPGVVDADGRPATRIENPTSTEWPARLFFDPSDGRLLEIDSGDAVAVVLEQGPSAAPPVVPAQ